MLKFFDELVQQYFLCILGPICKINGSNGYEIFKNVIKKM
jgi:hypothetical protein